MIILLLYIVYIYSILSDSVCSEVDTVFIFDSDVFINNPSPNGNNIGRFIEKVIFEASSEKSGVGFIVYGDVPNGYNDGVVLGLKKTKAKSTKATQKIIRQNLDKCFDEYHISDNKYKKFTFEQALGSAHKIFEKESKT
eukprot:7639_1